MFCMFKFYVKCRHCPDSLIYQTESMTSNTVDDAEHEKRAKPLRLYPCFMIIQSQMVRLSVSKLTAAFTVGSPQRANLCA